MFLGGLGTVESATKIASGLPGGPTLSDQDRFGIAATSLGDLDGDQVADLAVGALLDDTGGDARGAVHVLFMNPDGTVKATSKVTDGSGVPPLEDGDRFGTSVASLADLNGDGIRDLAVGARGDDSVDENSGAVHLVSLDTDGTAKGTTLEFTVTRSFAVSTTSSVNVNTADGSAVAGQDYVPIIDGTLTFLPGQTSQTIVVPVIGDLVEDGAALETFQLILSNPVNATLGDNQAEGAIEDDEAPLASTMHVADLDAISTPASRGRWNVTVTIRVVDDLKNPVAGVTVMGDWSSGGSGSATTDANGFAVIQLDNINKKIQSVTFTVTSLVKLNSGLTYNEDDNTDPDGDSDGTMITINKPQ